MSTAAFAYIDLNQGPSLAPSPAAFAYVDLNQGVNLAPRTAFAYIDLHQVAGAATGPVTRVFHVSDWAAVPLKVHDGAWVEVPARAYVGGEW